MPYYFSSAPWTRPLLIPSRVSRALPGYCGLRSGALRCLDNPPAETGREVAHAPRAYPPVVILYSMDGLSALNRITLDEDFAVVLNELRMLG
jgi:hypothetical protein